MAQSSLARQAMAVPPAAVGVGDTLDRWVRNNLNKNKVHRSSRRRDTKSGVRDGP